MEAKTQFGGGNIQPETLLNQSINQSHTIGYAPCASLKETIRNTTTRTMYIQPESYSGASYCSLYYLDGDAQCWYVANNVSLSGREPRY